MKCILQKNYFKVLIYFLSIFYLEQYLSMRSNIYCNRIDNPKQRTQLFYAISLKQKLLRLYNQGGNLKIVRKLPIPDGVKIAKAGPYIICYSFNRITVINLLDPFCKVYQCQWNGYPITKACYDEKTKLIFFVEDNSNGLYYLMPQLQTINMKFLHGIGQPVSKLQVYSDSSVGVLCSQSQSLIKLTFNWKQNDELVEKQVTPGIVDCYFAQNWVATISSESQQGRQKLQINDAWFHPLHGAGKSVMSHRGNQSFFFLDLDNKQLIMVHNEQMISYQFKVQLPELVSEEFIFAASQEIEFQLLLVIKSFDKEEMKFNTHSYPIVRVKNKDPDIVFAKNIKYIFMPNGLVNPHMEGMLIKYCQRQLKGRDDQQSDQRRQQSQIPEDNEELAYYFFCLIIKTKPQFLQEIINSVIKSGKEYLLQAETKRFMDFCEKFLHVNLRITILKYAQQIEQKKLTKAISTQQLVNYCKQIVYFLKRMIEAIELQCKDYSEIKESQRLQNYKKILQCAKSYELVATLVGLQQLNKRIKHLFQGFYEEKRKNYQIWKTNGMWVKNQFDTLLCHEHFKKIKLLSEDIPKTHQFFKFLANNVQQYEEIAYFYIYLAKPLIVPYMPVYTLSFYQLIQKYPAMSTLQSRDSVKEIFPTLVSYAIQLGKFPFIKYLCEVAVNYQCYPQCLIMLQAEIYENSMSEHCQQDLIFALKCFVLIGKVNLAYLWVRKLKNHLFDKQQALKCLVELCVKNNRIHQFLVLQMEQKDIIKQQLKQSMKSQDFNKIQSLFLN